jgi:hypothetical protein
MEKIKYIANKIVQFFFPLFTDTNPKGERKVSIGRAPLFAVLVIMVFRYATQGTGPDAQILAFIGMAMAYNGFSKSGAAKGNGGERVEDPMMSEGNHDG